MPKQATEVKEICKDFHWLFTGRKASQRLEAAAAATLGGKLPYGPDEAMTMTVNLFLNAGGWGPTKEAKDKAELTIPTFEAVVVTADPKQHKEE